MTSPRVSETDVDKAFAAVSGTDLLNGLLGKMSPERIEERFEDELQRLLEKRIDSRKPVELDQLGTPIINDLDQLQRVATMYARSGLVPGSYLWKEFDWGNAEHFRMLVARVSIAISFGKKFGMDPLTALKWVYVVNNVPSLWGDAVPGVVRDQLRKRGDDYQETKTIKGEGETRTCTVTVKHIRKDGTVVEASESFSMADAKRARLTSKGPWQDSPDRMLLHRARTYCLRNMFPDIMMGLAVAEEERDVVEQKETRRVLSLDQTLASAKTAAQAGAEAPAPATA